MLSGNKLQQLRQATPGSIRMMGIEVKLSKSLLDLNAASANILAMPKYKYIRRFSEPANVRTHVHFPINPMVLLSKPPPTVPGAATIRFKEDQLKKARSFSL